MKRKVTKNLIELSLFLIFGIYSIICLSVYMYPKNNTKIKCDAAIVLGAAAWGNKPSPVFRERINHAIELYKNNHCDFLIFTGGKGFPQEPGESIIAKKYAIDNGIPEDRIFVENESQNTYENIKYAAEICNNLNFKNYFLVSDPYHLKRASIIAEDFNMIVYPSPTPTTLFRGTGIKIQFIIKESYLIILYYLESLINNMIGQ